MAQRLRRHPIELQQLTAYRRAIDHVLNSRVNVVTPSADLVRAAAHISQQHGLLSNDALVVAVMQSHGIAFIASHDQDFDRVTDLIRYSPE